MELPLELINGIYCSIFWVFRYAWKQNLRDRLGANTDNYMNDEHLFCFQCHKPLVISIIPLNANREATIGSMKWDPEGLKIKAQKTFNYDNTHREARKFIKKYLSQPGWNEGAKSSIFTKQCPKCNISAHFERSTYCSKCHKEELPVILCGCSRGYCVLCTLPSLTDDIKINGFCYKCNRFICEECASCCHFVDINCYKRFCHRCDEVCEFCGLETSCNEHQENSQWRQSYCYAPKQKNRNWYSFSNQQTNDENTEEWINVDHQICLSKESVDTGK